MYKIKLSDFLNAKEELAIHCKSIGETELLFDAFNFQGAKWHDGESYKGTTKLYYSLIRNCYSNKGMCGSIRFYELEKIKIYEFDEVNIYA